jgi:hypothetical protein
MVFFPETTDKIVASIEALQYNFGNMVLNFIYSLWKTVAGFCDVLEGMFRKLAGLGGRPWDPGKGVSIQEDAVGNHDLGNILIQNSKVTTIFSSILVIAVALLVFFTIIQIIREQYKNKDGGNPYTIVFRMFKAMITMLIIPAAVIAGFLVSGYVLSALDTAVKRGKDVTVSGEIFKAMSYSLHGITLKSFAWTRFPSD